MKNKKWEVEKKEKKREACMAVIGFCTHALTQVSTALSPLGNILSEKYLNVHIHTHCIRDLNV